MYKYPPPVPIPSQFDPVYTHNTHFLKIHLNIILRSTPESPKWSPSLKFSHQNPVYAFSLPHTRYMPRPSHSSQFYAPNNIWRGIHIIKFLIKLFSPLDCYLVRLMLKYSQHPILRYQRPTFLLQSGRPSFTPIQNNRQNCSAVYLITIITMTTTPMV